MLDTREIHSLTDFLRNHKAHVKRLKKTQAPEVLTVNGKAEGQRPKVKGRPAADVLLFVVSSFDL